MQAYQQLPSPDQESNLRITQHIGINDSICRYTTTYQSHQRIFEPGCFKPDRKYDHTAECVEKTNPFYKPENDCRNWKLYE